jgi:hypothetical protein
MFSSVDSHQQQHQQLLQIVIIFGYLLIEAFRIGF